MTYAHAALLLRQQPMPADARQRAFGELLRRRREELGWSQTQLSEAAGLRRISVGRIERAQAGPSLRTAQRLADALGVSLPLLLLDVEATVADQRARAS